MINGTDHLLEVLLSTTASFLVLLILARLLGKKQLSHLTFFNYITGITIGSIAANIVTLEGKDFFQTISALIWWCFLTYAVDLIVVKLPKARVILDGEPSVVIKKGHIQYETLRKIRLDIDSLLVLMREKDIFNLSDVDYAMLEPNGELTILKIPDQQNAVKKDLNIVPSPQLFLPTQIILSGLIIKKNLIELNLTYDWLYEQLHNNNIDKVEDVLYAELQSNGNLFIDKKDISKTK